MVNQVLRLLCPNGGTVEGHIVVQRLGVGDQPVIRDDLHAGCFSLLDDGGRGPEWVALALRVDIVDLAADHVLNQHRFGDFALVRIQGGNRLAVAQHGDRIGNGDDFFQLVRNHHAGDTVLFQLTDQVQQVFAVILIQGGGRFVQDEQFDILAQCLGNLDQLLLAHTQIFDLRPRIDVQFDSLDRFSGPFDGLIPINGEAALDLIAEEDVFVDRHFRDECQLLVDDGDADLLAVGDAREFLHLPIEKDVSVVGPMRIHPAQDLHEGGLARAIFAHKAVNLARGNLKADVAQCFHARERLGNVLHL